jgi:hypothetical protein
MMKDSNFFDLGPTPVKQYTNVKTSPSALVGQKVSNNSLYLSLSLAQPTGVSMRISTVSGRIVAAASKQERISGLRTVQFPLGSLAPGVYCLEVQAEQMSEMSSLLLR